MIESRASLLKRRIVPTAMAITDLLPTVAEATAVAQMGIPRLE
jgi:hypothetical protein